MAITIYMSRKLVIEIISPAKKEPAPTPKSAQKKKVEVAIPMRCCGELLAAMTWAQDIMVPNPRPANAPASKKMKLSPALLINTRLSANDSKAGYMTILSPLLSSNRPVNSREIKIKAE